MALIVIGIILYVIAALLIYNYFRLKKRMDAISSVETSTTAVLRDICQGVSSEIGAGSFEQPAEVKGMIECEQPIESEIAKQPCVYYSMAVTREWEEEYYEKDQKTGQNVRKTRKGSDTVASNSRSTHFMVRDDTGTILVNPNGARIDGEKVIDRFEPQTSISGGRVSFGKFSFSLGGGTFESGSRRTLGYRFRETLLPLNRRVYVLGSAADTSGELMIQKPREKGQFLISLKSEEELMASSKSGMTWSLAGGIISFLVGDGLVLWYLFSTFIK